MTTLNGAQEVPPVVTAGTGTGTLTVNLTTREISGTVTFSGLTSNAVAAHIHQGAPGVNGPVIVPLAGGSGGTSGTWTIPAGTILTQDQFNALQANNLYFNIHTTTNPNGEIRGQIRFTGITTTTILAGAQEVPPVATQGTGTATLTVDISTGQVINGVLVFSGLTSNAVAAHIHQGAAGVNGPVIIPLEGGAGATSGVWRVPAGTVLTPGQLNAFRANQLYFNIHTTINPGGEIRGQVIFPGGVEITTPLSGVQEVPPVTTSGSGIAAFTVNVDTREISGDLTFTGLTSNAVAAHIHQGVAGANGPVIIPLEGGAGATSGVWKIPAGTILTPDQLNALRANQLYFNIHTTINPGGEMRGQVIFPVGVTTVVPLTGAQEVPAVATPGTGTGMLIVNPDTREASGTVAFSGLTANAVAAHFHLGAAGVNGPVIINLEGGAGATSGVWRVPAGTVLTPDQLNALRANQLYFNIHTTANPGGEIRGQIIFGQIAFPAGTVITTVLNGLQEVPPVSTPGTATGALAVNLDTRVISGVVSFRNLTANAVAGHFHLGAAGTNGPVIIPLEGGAGAASGVWRVPAGTILTPDQLNALRANQLYLNIHTTTNPGGEIRGQVIFSSSTQSSSLARRSVR